MSKEKMSGKKAAAIIFISVFLLVAGFFMWAWAVQNLWNWFVAPLGIQTISFAHAMGIRLLAETLRGFNSRECKSNEKSPSSLIGTAIGVQILTPIVLYFIGMAVHYFM